MECEDINLSLLEYLREELSPERKAGVEKHLQDCPWCAAAFAEAGELWKRLDEPAARPSPRLRENFHALLRREAPADEVPPRAWGFLPARFARPSWVFSYSLVLMLSGMLLGEVLRPAERLAGFDWFVQENTAELTPERLVQLCSVSGAVSNLN